MTEKEGKHWQEILKERQKQSEKSWKCMKMQSQLKWIFRSNCTIESDSMDKSCCLRYGQGHQQAAGTFLWLNIFFRDKY